MESIPAAYAGIHGEHLDLLEELGKLEQGLGSLVNDSELSGDPVGALQVEEQADRLAAWLPQHFRREEETIFRQAAPVSRQLEQFCEVMKEEHADLLRRLANLKSAVKKLEDAERAYEALFYIQIEGKGFALRLRNHMALEEEEFNGFL